MVKSEREYRNMTMEIREAVEGEEDQNKVVTGYASTFDEPYKLFTGEGWEYWETVERTAFDETDMSDVIMQYDHEGRVFARTRNNTLRGYTDRMSFGFTVTGESEDKEQNDAGVWIYTRHITKVGKLYDVSAVSIPANDGTSIAADAVTRSIGNLTDGVIERIQAERLEEEKRALEAKRAEVRARALGGNN